MTIGTTFALGTKEAYFFNTPTHWAWHHLPAAVEAIFTSTPPLQDVLELALGAPASSTSASSATSGTYFLSYLDATGAPRASHYNLPNPLVQWLYGGGGTIQRDLRTLSVALGPWDSYYAWDCRGASWDNLPVGLEKAVLSRLDEGGNVGGGETRWKSGGQEAPCFVSLGADGAYFMRTVCGGGCWDLKVSAGQGKGGLGVVGGDGMEGLRGVNRFLEEARDFTGVAGLHIFPSNPTHYILVLTSGRPYSNLPECTWPDYNKLAPALPTYAQSFAPVPPMPQPRVVSPQGQPTQQQKEPSPVQRTHNNPGCCPPQLSTPCHNCCPPVHQPQV